jgi:integrase/recombinase XerD
MSALAPTLEAFFTERLIGQRQVSPHTVAAYRDTFRLLLAFISERTGQPPSRLDIEDLDATIIGAFLNHLEQGRGNSPRTRNARLAAIHSLFRFAALRHPEHAELIQRVLAIPSKKHLRREVTFLHPDEVDALLAAPDRSSRLGRRDHALLVLAIQTGLRLSELTRLRGDDLHLDAGPHVRCHGKGRKERITPLSTQTVDVLHAWLREHHDGPGAPLFPSRLGGHLSHDAVERLVAKHSHVAAGTCLSLRPKTVTPHVLRHTAAMRLLEAGVDSSVIALWLGHESVQTTQTYIHAHLELKERALARTAPATTTPSRYRPPDGLLAFLESL